ncbi:hypothetical protein I7I50_03879 [Histoplasma capsulatum G186AR]|uniref:Uncharacterized protein n=1 Tax=Ajellomyces capsulatus TaxID=5037 RepID=A0A8H7YLK7_AJECA|nr:hypothetical protein I7I52_04787 [Histoplasma capsulatum]QSS74916.1 hypothetical protein I7I50_03879 [Histoplasma capsulatum G186AR]
MITPATPIPKFPSHPYNRTPIGNSAVPIIWMWSLCSGAASSAFVFSRCLWRAQSLKCPQITDPHVIPSPIEKKTYQRLLSKFVVMRYTWCEKSNPYFCIIKTISFLEDTWECH